MCLVSFALILIINTYVHNFCILVPISLCVILEISSKAGSGLLFGVCMCI